MTDAESPVAKVDTFTRRPVPAGVGAQPSRTGPRGARTGATLKPSKTLPSFVIPSGSE